MKNRAFFTVGSWCSLWVLVTLLTVPLSAPYAFLNTSGTRAPKDDAAPAAVRAWAHADCMAAHARQPIAQGWCDLLLPEGAVTQSNVYRNTPGGSHLTWRAGSRRQPVTQKTPMLWLERYFSNDAWEGRNFDNGVAYFQSTKLGGDARAATLTARAIHEGGTREVIAIHGRAQGTHKDASLFGGWFYAFSPKPFDDMAGVEINVNNRGQDIGWVASGFPKGVATGLNISTADRSSTPSTQALYIAAQRSNGSRGWYTGMFVHGGAIEPTDAKGNGEVVRVHGAPSEAEAFKLLRARTGFFVSGVETFAATFARGVMEMARGQYLAWGGSDTASGSARLTVNEADALDFSGSGLQLAPQSAAPKSPRPGLILFADGTRWNPGQGAGFYGYDGTRWVRLGGGE